MNFDQVIAAESLLLKKPISIVNEYVGFVMNTKPQSRVRIIRDYPFGWHAEVAALDRVWVVACVNSSITLLNVSDSAGMKKNGSFVRVGVKDAIEDEVYFLGIDFTRDHVFSPLTCDSFFLKNEPPCFKWCKKKFVED